MRPLLARILALAGILGCLVSLLAPWGHSEQGTRTYSGFSDSETTIPLIVISTLIILELLRQQDLQQDMLRLLLVALAFICVIASLIRIHPALTYVDDARVIGSGWGQYVFLMGLVLMGISTVGRLMGNKSRFETKPWRAWFLIGTLLFFASLFTPLGVNPFGHEPYFLYAIGFIGGPLSLLYIGALCIEFSPSKSTKEIEHAGQQLFICAVAASVSIGFSAFALLFHGFFRLGAIPFWAGQAVAMVALLLRMLTLRSSVVAASESPYVAPPPAITGPEKKGPTKAREDFFR